MHILNGLVAEEEGQNLVEYTLMIGLVVLLIWVAISVSQVPQSSSNIWSDVSTQFGVAGSGS